MSVADQHKHVYADGGLSKVSECVLIEASTQIAKKIPAMDLFILARGEEPVTL